MRKRIVQWAVLTVAFGVLSNVHAASFSWRFVGLNALKEKKDLVVFQQVTGLPEFEGFRTNLAARVAATIAKPLAQKGGNEAELTKLLLPIAADLTAFPTIYEHEAQGESNIWALAIQLPADRAEVWKNNWATISKGVTVTRQGDWTLVGNGPTKNVLEKTKKAADDVLQMSGDNSFLQKFLPAALNLNPSKADVHVTVQGKALRTEGKMQFEKDLPFQLTKWEIPSHTITEPLIGFTAVQGLKEHLGHVAAFNGTTAPNQVFIWSQDRTPFSSYMAAKVDKSETFTREFFQNANLKSMTNLMGDFQYDTNTHGLYVQKLPIVVPFLRPGHPQDAGFVYAGFMPFDIGTNGMPAELAREVIGRTNLVYYDWEIGGPRLTQVLPIRQIFSMMTTKPTPTYERPEFKWLIACEDKIGNNVTEVTKTGARELSLVRRSDLGLSAVELYGLTQWIAGPPTQKAHGVRKAGPTEAVPAPKPATPR